jgi:cytoskeletal protein CcmA (bactofilin family)
MLFNERLNSYRHAAGPRPLDQALTFEARSVIDQRLLITGDLGGDGELQVDGKVAGNIRCGHLLVGKERTINGNVIADQVVVRGRVRGTIRADRVIFQDKARVRGDVFYKALTIEEGAYFQGHAHYCNDPMNIEAELAAEAEFETVTDTPIKRAVGLCHGRPFR